MSTLLEAGQWMLAPTDVAGRNPRPDLAPDIVVNSWGFPQSTGSMGNEFSRWYKEIVDAWVAAGIFPALDLGPRSNEICNFGYSPGQYANGYTATAFGADDKIWGWTARGPGEDGSGEQRLKVVPATPACVGTTRVTIGATGGPAQDIALDHRLDAFGYGCVVGFEPYVGARSGRPSSPPPAIHP
ncbi:hypothetical protein [Sinosporangium siamense]|uniref:Uncharacterized protein n=1 Tax=Sinosporangium siamense TaxID=1367973 RepID=A0A919RHW9_9ACTN|nr:hypothetical protein [Sinosporangium siamense]GII92139.1 hypothetical protein Ssi02_23700 [Sinosporangium siamense]